MIPLDNLEPGGVYENKKGQRREIVKMDGAWLIYRILSEGKGQPGIKVEVGAIRDTNRCNFARWALKEVA